MVTQYFWPEEFRVNDLAVELSRRGHEVTVLTGHPTYPSRDLFPGAGGLLPRRDTLEGVRIQRVPLASRGRGEGRRLALNFLSFAASAALLGPLLVRGRPDVVFVYEPSPVTVALPALVFKRLRRTPVVLWVQDLWPETLAATGAVRSPAVLHLVGRLVRRIYRACDRILVESRSFTPSVVARGGDPERVAYLPNWAESSYAPLVPAEDAPERILLPQGFNVVFAGNLGTAQSLATLLDAADRLREHPDVHWVVLGDGRQRGWLEREVARRGLGGTVHVLGRFPVHAMPVFFGLADGLLVTLARQPIYALTLPSKVQSYLASGKPVLGALDGEGRRVLEESGAGLTTAAEDGAGLAQAVLRLHAMSPGEREQMGERGRAYFREHFERDRLVDEMEKVLMEAAGA